MDRKDIENYLDNNNIKYIVDKTNLESEYTRNSVRNELLPFIKEKYNSNIDETIFRMSQIIKDEKELLDNLTKDTLEKILIKTVLKNDTKIKSVKIDLNLFNKENIALRRRILRYIINNYFNIYKNISKINIDDAIKLAYNNIGNKYTLLNKDIKVSVLKGVLTIEQI